jgi:DNA-binding NarL/FixJ family response regulator
VHKNKDAASGDILRLNLPSGASGGIEFPAPIAARDAVTILVIERRAFYRDCIVQTLSSQSDLKVLSAASVKDWSQKQKREPVSLVLLCSESSRIGNTMSAELADIAQSSSDAAVVIISDLDRVDSVVGAIANGARGFIPTDTGLEVAIGALKMVNSGGTYVPASSLMAAHKKIGDTAPGPQQASSMFTSRQIAVIEALRKGKANKTIAYELNMCESTVKVHVRNIMKRLKAKNRTQVAYLAGELLSSGALGPDRN